jgi:hypothetical protein
VCEYASSLNIPFYFSFVEITTLNSDRSLKAVQSVSVREQSQANYAINTALGYVAILLPIVFVLYVVGYQRYRTHALKRKVAKLERIWCLSLQEKKHE